MLVHVVNYNVSYLSQWLVCQSQVSKYVLSHTIVVRDFTAVQASWIQGSWTSIKTNHLITSVTEEALSGSNVRNSHTIGIVELSYLISSRATTFAVVCFAEKSVLTLSYTANTNYTVVSKHFTL